MEVDKSRESTGLNPGDCRGTFIPNDLGAEKGSYVQEGQPTGHSLAPSGGRAWEKGTETVLYWMEVWDAEAEHGKG